MCEVGLTREGRVRMTCHFSFLDVGTFIHIFLLWRFPVATLIKGALDIPGAIIRRFSTSALKVLIGIKRVSASALKAFVGIEKHDSTASASFKVGKAIAYRTLYARADELLMAASWAYIVLMKQLGYDSFGLFLLMWGFDIAVACMFVAFSKRTGEDVTLGQSYRRAADAIHNESRLAGYLVFAGVILKASIWDGPEQIVIFFNKEIKTELRMLIALLVLTALQAAFWTPVYVLGFESGMELFQLVFSAL